MLDLIKDREGIDKPFHAEPYLYNLVSNIHLAAMYSNKVKLSESEMEKFKFVSYAFSSDLGDRIFRYEFVPYMKYFMANPFDMYRKYFAELHEFSANHFQRHTETYDKENRRNFCDLLIGAKHEAEANEKVSAQHLTDINMATTLLDIFLTSVDVTHMLLWIILLVAYYPDVQQKIRDEIRSELGDRPVTGDDRHKLHYTMAYVYEVFRYRNSAPIGFFHKTLKDCKLGKFSLPKDTCVVVHQYSILMDDNYWDKPDEFNPGRFLDDQDKLIAVKPAAFIPFGYGRRVCIGEQMAYNNLFVTLCCTHLVFRNYKKHWNLELIKLYKIYGPVFTIWIGPWPFVIVCDLDIAKEAFSKVDFSGRPPNDKHTEIAFADYGKTWEALRKVGHSAVRKYAKSVEVSHLVNETVAEVLDAIKDREGIDKPFPAEPYSFHLFANIHMSAVFSQK
ncbi:unnamed protein product, partial [Oppiella nova]